jgi:hypothetical protein
VVTHGTYERLWNAGYRAGKRLRGDPEALSVTDALRGEGPPDWEAATYLAGFEAGWYGVILMAMRELLAGGVQ